MNITPYQYILNLRIELARELMDKLPLAIVAQEAGFSDESHLIREFKKRFGFTPKKLYNF
jgi:AraC-like DNA-binding protein